MQQLSNTAVLVTCFIWEISCSRECLQGSARSRRESEVPIVADAIFW